MKILKRTLLVLISIAIIYAGRIVWQAMNIISAYGAKDLCSCVYVSGRDAKDVVKNELNFWPISYGSFEIQDSAAVGSVLGIAKHKAIYRKGLGCTFVTGVSEEDLRREKMNLYNPPKINTDTIAWPTGDKLPQVISEKIDQKKLQEVIDHAFVETDTAHEKLKRTRAVLVVYDGQLVGEKYGGGFNRNTRQMGWSMAKSINNTLIGILVRQGKLTLEQPAPIEAWKNDDRKNITLNHLLQMSSGLHWVESYVPPPETATIMLYQQKDMAAYAIAQPLEAKPGEVFNYSGGTANILSLIIRNTVGNENYYRFPYQELFGKIGMNNIVLEADASGTFATSSYVFASARDYARFGLLYLNDGVWQGERILPEGWVKYTSTPAPAAKQGEYGAQWWTNAGEKNNPANRPYPDIPADAFLAEGHETQSIFVVPSKKLVVVRLGLTESKYKDTFDVNKFVSEVIAALPQ